MEHKITLRIHCQHFENYNFDEPSKPFWKRKGMIVFEAEVSSDRFMYDEDTVKEALKEIIKGESNEMSNYEIVEIEPLFHKPENITKKLEAELAKVSA